MEAASMSILTVLRRHQHHPTLPRPWVHLRQQVRASRAESPQQPLQQRQVHATDQRRELAAETVKRAVAQPQRLTLAIGLIAALHEHRLDETLRLRNCPFHSLSRE